MEIIYKSFDNKEFKDKDECLRHERSLMQGVKMWDGDGRQTKDVTTALVIMVKENCMPIFHQMCKDYVKEHNEPEENIKKYIGGLEEDLDGYFLWNESTEEYDYLTDDYIRAIVSLAQYEDVV